MTNHFDTLVVGAGLAGIAAAARLSAAGQRVALIEARSRFGGRVWTRRDPHTDYPLELGPEFFGEHGPIHQALAKQKLGAPKGDGTFMRRIHGELVEIADVDDAWHEVHQRLAMHRGADRSLESALHECCDTPKLEEAAVVIRNYVSGFHAADPADLSLAWLRQVEENAPAGASELRARDGLDRAIDGLLMQLSSTCTVFLNTTVKRVRWRRRRVSAECMSGDRAGAITADAAVVTLPAALLSLPAGGPGSVEFAPALAGKRKALGYLATGPVLKLNLVFDAPFWRDLSRLNDALFIQDFSQPIPTWWTSLPVDAPVIAGWAAGVQLRRIASVDDDALRQTAIRSLAAVLAVPAETVEKHLRACHWHDWQGDPFAQGAYTWVRTGGVEAYATLAKPLHETLFFAGEATCGEGLNATMDGAIKSGWRAAEEVLGS